MGTKAFHEKQLLGDTDIIGLYIASRQMEDVTGREQQHQ